MEAFRWDHQSWSSLGRIDCEATVVARPEGGLVVLGGEDSGEIHGRARAWLPHTGWQDLPPLPKPRARARAAHLSDGRLVVVGGFYTDDMFEDMVDGGEFDIETRSFPRRLVRGPARHRMSLFEQQGNWRGWSMPAMVVEQLIPLANHRVVVTGETWTMWSPIPADALDELHTKLGLALSPSGLPLVGSP
jgi:hypothetical protein